MCLVSAKPSSFSTIHFNPQLFMKIESYVATSIKTRFSKRNINSNISYTRLLLLHLLAQFARFNLDTSAGCQSTIPLPVKLHTLASFQSFCNFLRISFLRSRVFKHSFLEKLNNIHNYYFQYNEDSQLSVVQF